MPASHVRELHSTSRQDFVGGSDARIIMGSDQAALLRLCQEKRREVVPEDLSGNLIVQLGNVTEDLNRRWYERNTGHIVKHVQRRIQHRTIGWMAATLDGLVEPSGAVFEAKFMLPWTFSEEGAAEKHMAQLQHNMWVAAKNTLTADDARILEAAYQTIVDSLPSSDDPNATRGVADGTQDDLQPEAPVGGPKANAPPPAGTPLVRHQAKPLRRRNKAHLAFVAAQPCVICQRTPCDAHHLKFAQPKALGRKVSDEFTVPLCRDHHHELHGGGNEMAWWGNLQIAPVEIAKGLWQSGPAHRETTPSQT